MPDDCMRHFRLKTRYLMDRLVRKFGYDLVSAIVPKDNVQMHKRLKNIKKVQVKKKKDKDARAAAAAGDEDDDSDDMADEKFKVWVAMFLVDLTLENVTLRRGLTLAVPKKFCTMSTLYCPSPLSPSPTFNRLTCYGQVGSELRGEAGARLKWCKPFSVLQEHAFFVRFEENSILPKSAKLGFFPLKLNFFP